VYKDCGDDIVHKDGRLIVCDCYLKELRNILHVEQEEELQVITIHVSIMAAGVHWTTALRDDSAVPER